MGNTGTLMGTLTYQAEAANWLLELGDLAVTVSVDAAHDGPSWPLVEALKTAVTPLVDAVDITDAQVTVIDPNGKDIFGLVMPDGKDIGALRFFQGKVTPMVSR